MPVEPFAGGAWMHPCRLPLGGGWRGHCTAPGHEGEVPSDLELHQSCNLGYASACPRCPLERARDALRFGVTGETTRRVLVSYVCEREHRPAQHGCLEFDLALGDWIAPHRDPRIQKMAACYLQSYLQRKSDPAASSAPQS